MILIWTPGAKEPKQYGGLPENTIKDLSERGYRVYFFDSSNWSFMKYSDDRWVKVPGMKNTDFPKTIG